MFSRTRKFDSVREHLEATLSYIQKHGWMRGGWMTGDQDDTKGCINASLVLSMAYNENAIKKANRYGELGEEIAEWCDDEEPYKNKAAHKRYKRAVKVLYNELPQNYKKFIGKFHHSTRVAALVQYNDAPKRTQKQIEELLRRGIKDEIKKEEVVIPEGEIDDDTDILDEIDAVLEEK